MKKRYLGVLSTFVLLLSSCVIGGNSNSSSSSFTYNNSSDSDTDSTNNNQSSEEHDHVLSYVEAKDATCGEDGNIAYYVCSICGECFSDANAENQISSSSVVIPATGEHTWVDNVCSSCGQDAGGTKGLNWTLNADNTYTVSGIGSASGNIVIPSTYNGLPVTAIGIDTDDYNEGAFYNCTSLTGISIPSSVTRIGDYAFCYCTNLSRITLPSSVTSIGDYAFYYDYNATIDVNGNIDTLGYKSFYYCKKLSSITLAEGLSSISDYAFYYCSNLGSINIPSSVTYIGDYSFYYCKGLTSLTIGDEVTSIGDYAFYHCDGLTSLSFGKKVESIGVYSFGYCSGLISVVIPDSVSEIGSSAFRYCRHLLSVTIGSGVTSIGDYAFYYDYKLVEIYNLSSLSISKSSTNNGYVGNYALDIYTSTDSQSKIATTNNGYIFYESGDTVYLLGYVGTSNELALTSTYNSKAYSIYQYAFYEKNNLKAVSFANGITSIGSYAFAYCYNLTSIVIPSSVTSIASNAFYCCYHLTSATIGSGVTSIGYMAFGYCYKLVEVYNLSYLTISLGKTTNGYVGLNALDIYTSTSETSKLMTTEEGYIFYENGDTVYLMGYTGDDTSLTLPSSFNNKNYGIYYYGFYYSPIESLVIPSGVTFIKNYAFRYCSSLTSLSIGDDVTSIGEHAFANCSSLHNVYIGKGLASIESNSFYSTYNIKSIEVSTANPNFYSEDNCLIETSSKTLVKGCSSSSIPSNITSIGDLAFYGCASLASLSLPSGLTSIGRYAFSSCSKITSVVIPSSCTSIGQYAFSGCSGLTSVTFENTSGWYVTKTANATSGTSVDVSDSSTNVTYLTSSSYYRDYYWYRS